MAKNDPKIWRGPKKSAKREEKMNFFPIFAAGKLDVRGDGLTIPPGQQNLSGCWVTHQPKTRAGVATMELVGAGSSTNTCSDGDTQQQEPPQPGGNAKDYEYQPCYPYRFIPLSRGIDNFLAGQFYRPSEEGRALLCRVESPAAAAAARPDQDNQATSRSEGGGKVEPTTSGVDVNQGEVSMDELVQHTTKLYEFMIQDQTMKPFFSTTTATASTTTDAYCSHGNNNSTGSDQPRDNNNDKKTTDGDGFDAKSYGERLAKWIYQRITQQNLFEEDCKAKDIPTMVGPAYGTMAGFGVDVGRCFTSVKSPHHTKPKTQFTLIDCRIWMRLLFWSLRTTSIVQKSPTFTDYYIRLIAYFIKIYNPSAGSFTRESYRWSSSNENITNYINNGRIMTDVLACAGNLSKSIRQIPINEWEEYEWPLQTDANSHPPLGSLRSSKKGRNSRRSRSTTSSSSSVSRLTIRHMMENYGLEDILDDDELSGDDSSSSVGVERTKEDGEEDASRTTSDKQIKLKSRSLLPIATETTAVESKSAATTTTKAAETTAKTTRNLDEHYQYHKHHDHYYYVPEEYKSLAKKTQQALCKMLSLSSLKEWEFNIWDMITALERDENSPNESGVHPLVLIAWAIFGSPYSQYSMKRICQADEDSSKKAGVDARQMDDYEIDADAGYDFISSSEIMLPIRKVCNYFRVIENDYYSDNPFHNEIHASDVLQSIHCLLQLSKSTTFQPTKVECFTLLFSAAVHDVRHPGRNNIFQIKARTRLSYVYNNQSILENMHCSHAFFTLLQRLPKKKAVISHVEYNDDYISYPTKKSNDGDIDSHNRNNKDQQEEEDEDDDLNILSNLARAQFDEFRDNAIQAILHTDPSKHVQQVNTIKTWLTETNDDDNSAITGDQDTATSLNSGVVVSLLNAGNPHRWEVLCYMLHLADISNLAKPHLVSVKWTDRVLEEFFLQGDEEAQLGLPVSPLCDRETTKKPDSQMGFIQFVVKPGYDLLATIFPQLRDCVIPYIEQNFQYWEELGTSEK